MMTRSQNWLSSVSDMMSALMMIFLFIAISYMIVTERAKKAEIQKNEQLEKDKLSLVKEKIKLLETKVAVQSIAYRYQYLKEDIYRALVNEFAEDLPIWRAEIEKASNIIRFKEPEILFSPGDSVLKNKFEIILAEFFPRYINILTQERFVHDIAEVRIEGHTSSDWHKTTELNQRYLNNARLSQERAFSVLEYCFALKASDQHKKWLISTLRANGLSFANPIIGKEGEEDQEKSRRVEFRVITKAEEKVYDILELYSSDETN